MGDFVRNRLPKLFRRHSISNTRPAHLAHNPQSDVLPSTPADTQQYTQYHNRPASRLQTVLDTHSLESLGQDLARPPPLFPFQHLLHDTSTSASHQSQPPIVTLEAPSPPPVAGGNTSIISSGPQHAAFQNAPPSPPTSHLADERSSLEVPDLSQNPPPSPPHTLLPVDQSARVSGQYVARVPDDVQEPAMSRRKIWVRRPGASPTLVQISQDDMVDDVRDMVLRKYANSLGRTFDAPDVVIRIAPRERSQQSAERVLNPEEPICRILDSYFPGGQSVEEALLVEVAARRTPRPSPRADHVAGYFPDQNHRPVENEGDYFPPMPPAQSPLPQPGTAAQEQIRPTFNNFHPAHTLASLEGPLPPLPSPRERRNPRPRMGRQHTSSPTIINGSTQRSGHPVRPRNLDAEIRSTNHAIPAAPPLPTPPAPSADPMPRSHLNQASTPPLDRVSPPRTSKPKRLRRTSMSSQHRPAPDVRRASDKAAAYTLLEGVVPPINVLIVEDNPINMLILEKFARILKVRWQTAMNGRDAVLKWKTGGFHLVLMDIQLPIMSGLEATKEIRRLERVNGIGVFARAEGNGEQRVPSPVLTNGAIKEGSAVSGDNAKKGGNVDGDDKLSDTIFKSPVIIVALTASSLQSDRHEALAAGCNDFLTKPVSFPWLERKVLEWGCMQALIDFDGWRKWKDMAEQEAKEKEKAAGGGKKGAGGRDDEAEKKKAAKAAILARMKMKPTTE